MDLDLLRLGSFGHGTYGRLSGAGSSLPTVERPWLGNVPNKSCIPQGVYEWEPWVSPTHGNCLIIHSEQHDGVPHHQRIWKTKEDGERFGGRWGILIHVANTAEELAGCVAPGLEFGTPYGRWGVTQSRDAMSALLRATEGKGGGMLRIYYEAGPQWP